MHTKKNAVMSDVSRRAFLKGTGAVGLTIFGRSLQGSLIAETVRKAADRVGKKVNLLPELGLWGWQFTEGARIADVVWPKGHSALEVHSESGDYARFLVLGPTIGKTYTLSGWVKVQDVRPQEEAAGAYFSASQYEFQGRPTQFTVDEDQLKEKHSGNYTGDIAWQRFSQSFICAPSVAWVEIVAGLYRASGTAWFAGLTLVEGDKTADVDEVVDLWQATQWAHEDVLKSSGRGKRAAAILRDAIPVRGYASDPQQVGRALSESYDVSYLSADQLADAAQLNNAKFDLLVLPYGESFPLDAKSAVLAFLAAGGDLLTMGGYAFQSPVIRKDSAWKFYDDVVRDEGGVNLLPSFPDGWKKQGTDYVSAEGSVAVVQVPTGHWEQNTAWFCDIPAKGEAQQYFFTAQISCKDVRPAPDGYGYISIVQQDENGYDVYVEEIVLEELRGTHEEHKVERLIFLAPQCHMLRIRCGLKYATGQVRATDFRLEHRSPQVRINTAYGFPQDELRIDPHQIGMFDADFRLKNAASLHAYADQCVVNEIKPLSGDVQGYAATCVVGMEKARWIPLLDARDELGCKRGAAGALVHNVRGEYARGSWAFFGVENRDIFAIGNTEGESILHDVARALASKCFLHRCETDFACYRQGETVRARVLVSNFGREAASLKVRWRCVSAEQQEAFTSSQKIDLQAGETRMVETTWRVQHFSSDFYSFVATLSQESEGKCIDRIETGFPVWSEEMLRKGLPFEFKDNYFQVHGRSMFLQGTDDYAHTFVTQDENPLTWKEDAQGCRDSCIDVYENLLGLRGPQQRPTKTWWRWIDAMLLNVQHVGGVFFPGMLIFSNTAVSDKDMADQQAYVEAFAERYKDAAGIMYYLNGDLELHNPNLPDLQHRYNEYLRDKYGSDAALRDAWKITPPEKPIGELAIRNGGADWSDIRTLDDFHFRTYLVRRWLNGMYDSVRKVDKTHPVTAEFYQHPSHGIDLLNALGNLELANFGYFDLKDDDYYFFPQTCKFLDQRVRGKGINIGEFGVKTHPAWNGCSGYVEARTEHYEQAYFLAIAHYGFALGASKIQNWCWKYPSDLPFEWGINYSNELIGRDVLAFYRNSGLLFRSLRPHFESSDTLVLLPGDNRKGGQGERIAQALRNGIRLLMDQRVPFNTLPDEYIDEIPAGVKTIFYPLPYCPSDAIVKRLTEFVEAGGQVYLSGDISYDSSRNRTRTQRLKELCGMEFVSERYPNIAYQKGTLATEPAVGSIWPAYEAFPGIVTKTAGATVLLGASGGVPVVTEFKRGKGRVIFSADPIELHGDPRYHDYVSAFYRALVTELGLANEAVEPASELVHCFHVPSQDEKDIRVLVNYGADGKSRTVSVPTAAGKARLTLDSLMPGVVVAQKDKGVLVVESSGDVAIEGRTLVISDLHFIAMSLDERALNESKVSLLLPMGEGKLRLSNADRWHKPVFLFGEIQNGQWKQHQKTKASVDGNALELTVSGATRLAMVIVCEEDDVAQAVRRVKILATEPWSLDRAQ